MGVGREKHLRAVAHHVGDLKRIALPGRRVANVGYPAGGHPCCPDGLPESGADGRSGKGLGGRAGRTEIARALGLQRRRAINDRWVVYRRRPAEPRDPRSGSRRRALLASPSWSDPKATSGFFSPPGAGGTSVLGGPTSAAKDPSPCFRTSGRESTETAGPPRPLIRRLRRRSPTQLRRQCFEASAGPPFVLPICYQR
jgi:hypothetical protein